MLARIWCVCVLNAGKTLACVSVCVCARVLARLWCVCVCLERERRHTCRERGGLLWHKSSFSAMVTWQMGGEALSVLPLLCLKIWHAQSQQQQWCNLVTSLWHLYSRLKPGSYLPCQRLYIQRGRSSCFPSDCEGINKEGWELGLTCPSVKRQTPHFFQPWRRKT